MGDALKDHIKKQLSKGYKPEEIKKALLQVGFSSSEVNEAFKQYEPKKKPFLHRIFPLKQAEKTKESKPKEKKTEARKQYKAKTEIKIPSLVEIFKIKQPEITARPEPKELPGPTTLALPPPPRPFFAEIAHHKKMGVVIIGLILIIAITAGILFFVTPICFTEKCFIDTANECGQANYKNSIKGTTVSYETKGCILIKTVTSLGPEEPAEIVDAFLGKSMTCRYQQNKFDQLYLTTLTGLINTCEGPLKEEVMKRVV